MSVPCGALGLSVVSSVIVAFTVQTHLLVKCLILYHWLIYIIAQTDYHSYINGNHES